MKKKFAFLVLSLALFTSCATHKYSQINHSKFYQEDYPDNVFKTNVFNSNDSISELFVQVDINTLAVLSGISRAEVLNNFVLDYSLVEGNKEKEVIQVGRINLFDSPDQSEFYKSFKIRLKTKTLGAFVLFSSIENKTKSKVYTSRTDILKGLSFSEQDYILLNEDGSIHWSRFIGENERVKIRVNKVDAKELYISWYAPKFSPAVVPFAPVRPNELKSLDKGEPMVIKLTNGISTAMEFKDLGVYLLQLNPRDNKGFSVFKFYNGFPYINNDAQRLFSLRYLNPRWEFEDLMALDPEKAVHDFWYFKSRKKDRSEDMEKVYYGRMQRSNELFTSYKEGWKTDRGMLFMVYGAPDRVYKYKNSEVWEYGRHEYYRNLRFRFERNENPFTQNDFRLFRQAHYEPGWQGIVENWRNDI